MIKKILFYLSFVVLSVIAIALIILLINEPGFLYGEIILSFTHYIAPGSLIISIILLIVLKRKFFYLHISLFLIILIFTFVHTIPLPAYEKLKKHNIISVIHYNVYLYNRNKNSIVKIIKKENPHVVTLHEMNWSFHSFVAKKLKKQYPFWSGRTGRFQGMMIYSKFPIVQYKIKWIGYNRIIIARIKKGDKIFSLVTCHPYAPISKRHFLFRNKQIKRIANAVKKIRGPLIVTGDFNAVPWSSVMRDFKEKTKLTDSRKSFMNTFPSKGFVKVPIDYIFTSKEIIPLRSKRLYSPFSDHFGIYSELQYK